MKYKILIVEDNEDIRENTAEILELADYEVVTAKNGKEGVELAKEHLPDLIICDIMMPELDGYGALYALQKSEKTSKIPFVFLSAKTEIVDLRKGMNLGADDYLFKPFDELELLQVVESRIKKYNQIKEGKNHAHVPALDDEVGVKLDEGFISQMGHLKNFKEKDALYQEGTFPHYVYYIKSGKVKTAKSNEDGKEYITALHSAGDFIGLISMLDNTLYSESAVALDDSEVVMIPKEEFFNLLYSNKATADKFIKILAGELAETESKLIKLAYNSVRKRVAEALIELWDKYNSKKEDLFSIAISREDLANMVGTAKESVIRTLSDFKAEKLIEIQSNKIVILNEEKLRKMRN